MSRVITALAAAVAGFACMVTLVVIIEILLMQVSPGSFTDPDGGWKLPEPLVPWYAANLAYSTGAAVLGGWVASRLAGEHRRFALTLVYAFVIVFNAATLLGPSDHGLTIPAWWTVGELIVGVAGVALGAALQHRQPATRR